MAWHNVTKAAVLVGKSRKTLYRYMANGELSCRVSADGKKEIETAELIRVFGELIQGNVNQGETLTRQETDELSQARAEIQQLKMLLEERNARIKDKEAVIDNMQLLLTQQKPRESGLDRLFGAMADRMKK